MMEVPISGMSKKIAVVNYQKCKPEDCKGGVCTATIACKRKSLLQEIPFEMPDSPMICVGCGDCVQACPLEAVIMV
jgi:translation initiation factor RLI1